MHLRGGGEVDLTVLSRVTTLEEVSFRGSSAVSAIAPLAAIDGLRRLDVTNCSRVTDRSAFGARAALQILPEL